MFVDECTFGINEQRARSYAPRGQGVVVDLLSSVTERVYSISGITPRGQLFSEVQPRAYTSEKVIAFLKQVLQKLAGEVHVVWDNASIHTSQRIRRFLAKHRRMWLHNTPRYCPWYNPDEQVWNYVKHQQLKFQVARNRTDMMGAVSKALAKLAQQPERIRRYFHHQDVKLMKCPVRI